MVAQVKQVSSYEPQYIVSECMRLTTYDGNSNDYGMMVITFILMLMMMINTDIFIR